MTNNEIDIAQFAAHAALNGAHVVTSYSDTLALTQFDSECVDGRFAVIHDMLIDLTQYDDRYVVSLSVCEDVFDATCDASHGLDESAFVCAVSYDSIEKANDMFVKYISDSLSIN